MIDRNITHNTFSVSQFASYHRYCQCQENHQNTNNALQDKERERETDRGAGRLYMSTKLLLINVLTI